MSGANPLNRVVSFYLGERMKTVSWFSAGASSAIATWYALQEHPDLEIIYTHIEDQHPDTMRFLNDCEKWYAKEIKVLQSPYKNVDNVIRNFKYVNGPGGARCTATLKRRVRKEWEYDNSDDGLRYVWGFDANERHRAERIPETMPDQTHIFPLIERQLNKTTIHGLLEKAGIKRPAMYELGYGNNNCIGCVKGGMGYWNKIRKDFPDVFKQRAEVERLVGHSCIKGVFLDELPVDAGRAESVILPDCGLFCELLTS